LKTSRKKVSGYGVILMLLLGMQVQTVSVAKDKDNFKAICGDALGAGIPATSAAVGTGVMFIPGVSTVAGFTTTWAATFLGALAGRHSDEWCDKIKKKMKKKRKEPELDPNRKWCIWNGKVTGKCKSSCVLWDKNNRCVWRSQI